MTHRSGRFRDDALTKVGARASALAITIAAIAHWNTTYLDRAIEELTRREGPIEPALLATLTPLGWAHINITGDYIWTPRGVLRSPDGFRLLRSDPSAENRARVHGLSA